MRVRLATVWPHRRLVAGVLAANVAVLTAAAVLHSTYNMGFALAEGGLLNSVDAAHCWPPARWASSPSASSGGAPPPAPRPMRPPASSSGGSWGRA